MQQKDLQKNQRGIVMEHAKEGALNPGDKRYDDAA